MCLLQTDQRFVQKKTKIISVKKFTNDDILVDEQQQGLLNIFHDQS